MRARLERQAEGLTGHAEELYRDIGQSDWLTNAGVGGEFAWERGPYYARGLVALALTLGDEKLTARGGGAGTGPSDGAEVGGRLCPPAARRPAPPVAAVRVLRNRKIAVRLS